MFIDELNSNVADLLLRELSDEQFLEELYSLTD